MAKAGAAAAAKKKPTAGKQKTAGKKPAPKAAGSMKKAVAAAAGGGGAANGNVMYGITSCDTVRNARNWLEAKGVECRFHDIRKEKVTQRQVDGWLEGLGGWEGVVNKRSSAWRSLGPAQQAGFDEKKLLSALNANATLLKRPLLVTASGSHISGFSAAQYEKEFS
ncbi:hypothetical protein DIPPA_26449 [Diplonema papillatum]|nr:hypothetical protein DIPPA_26449 [Diplonema papillatum]